VVKNKTPKLVVSPGRGQKKSPLGKKKKKKKKKKTGFNPTRKFENRKNEKRTPQSSPHFFQKEKNRKVPVGISAKKRVENQKIGVFPTQTKNPPPKKNPPPADSSP